MKYHDDEEEEKVLDDDKRILFQPLRSVALKVRTGRCGEELPLNT